MARQDINEREVIKTDATEARQAYAMALRVGRARLGISRTELARRAGMSKHTIAAYERGTRVPTLQYAAALADALGTSLDEMVRPS